MRTCRNITGGKTHTPSRLFCGAAFGLPNVAVLADPVEEGTFESNVFPLLLRFDPLVLEDLVALSEEFVVECRL